ncbi:type II toxin-antitoxin system Phd/YefM family antitoxin [Pelagibius litoralis]|uniref:Type II toxin-antitoxin system Phd/YefM family antitoxin n=1 Tax=Pelagibius litoralis TaxID=374515 RepID=A0A967KD70_9PROT|nr:type II toxin-antitoxin system Phd/YefM family antitoxin [Pelagibius litoralis]NIA71249.1 type II toxin-antitoxin system Phd/YefM family antitoxin [Pelagibius litoralis]
MKVTSSQFIRSVGLYQDQAQIEPVIVMKRKRAHTVLLSAEEYRRLRRRARIVQRTEEMSDADIEAIGRAEVPSGHEDLNLELD